MTRPARTAVVTGAGSPRGIGRAVGLALAQRGWGIAVLDIDRPGVSRTVAAIEASGGTAHAVPVDLTDAGSVEDAVLRISADLPPVGAVVNNAGITSPTAFLETTLDEWERIFAVNVRSQFLLTRALLPGMIARRFGRVVSVSSAAGQRGGGYFGGAQYSASKAAVLGLVRALAREFSGHGITFNSVAPGAIDTDITAGAMTAERLAAIKAATPVGRLGTAHEVASLIAFLCSDDAAFITGATYDVNGGSHIH